MIVPHTRLIWITGLVGLPCAALGGILPEWLMGIALFALSSTGFILLDAFRSRHGLRQFRIESPDLVRLSKDRAGHWELQIHHPLSPRQLLHIGIDYPPEFKALAEDQWVSLQKNHPISRIRWSCTPQHRGVYHLTHCYLEVFSPWRFWTYRKAHPIQTELRVYPNLFTEREMMAAIFLNQANIGLHTQRQVGQGRDFEKLRKYLPGDSLNTIHWRATAKRGHLVTKEYEIERIQEIYVVVDASRLSARSSHDKEGASNSETILERFISTALILGLVAEKQGDLFGLLTFSDQMHSFIRAKAGTAHFNTCRDAIYTLDSQSVTPNFEELCAFIRTRLRRRALLAILTNLDDPVLADSFVRNISIIAKQHLVLVHTLQSPQVAPLYSHRKVEQEEALYSALAGHVRWHQLKELEKQLLRQGVQFSQATQEHLALQLVTQYLNVKNRQLL